MAPKTRSAVLTICVVAVAVGIAAVVGPMVLSDGRKETRPVTKEPVPEPPAPEPAPPSPIAGIELPASAGAVPIPKGKWLTVAATADGRLWLEGESIAPPAFAGKLASRIFVKDKPAVLISADVGAPWVIVFEMLKACGASGVELDWIFWRCAGEGATVAIPTPPIYGRRPPNPVEVELQSRDGKTFVNILDPRKSPRPIAEAAKKMALELGEMRDQRGERTVVIRGLDVHLFGDVFCVADAAREAGFEQFDFRLHGSAKYDPTAPEYRLPEPTEFEDPEIAPADLYAKAVRGIHSPSIVRLSAPQDIRAGATLPILSGGVVPWGESRVEVLITKDRQIWAGGHRLSEHYLERFLAAHADQSRDDRWPNKPSRQHVHVRADAAGYWADLAAILEVCAMPRVRIYQIHLAIQNEDGELRTVPLFLPPARGMDEKRPRIRLELRRSRNERTSTLALYGAVIGAGDAAFESLGKRLLEARSQLPAAKITLKANSTVPVSEVARAVVTLRNSAWSEIEFSGRR